MTSLSVALCSYDVWALCMCIHTCVCVCVCVYTPQALQYAPDEDELAKARRAKKFGVEYVPADGAMMEMGTCLCVCLLCVCVCVCADWLLVWSALMHCSLRVVPTTWMCATLIEVGLKPCVCV